jgi:hypothetical protein
MALREKDEVEYSIVRDNSFRGDDIKAINVKILGRMITEEDVGKYYFLMYDLIDGYTEKNKSDKAADLPQFIPSWMKASSENSSKSKESTNPITQFIPTWMNSNSTFSATSTKTSNVYNYICAVNF